MGIEQSIDGHAAALGYHHGLPFDHLGEVEPAGIAQRGRGQRKWVKESGRGGGGGEEQKDMISCHRGLDATPGFQ